MHSHCFAQYTRYIYTFALCAKSLGDMSVYFGMLDSILAKDAPELPAAYACRRQVSAVYWNPSFSLLTLPGVTG